MQRLNQIVLFLVGAIVAFAHEGCAKTEERLILTKLNIEKVMKEHRVLGIEFQSAHSIKANKQRYLSDALDEQSLNGRLRDVLCIGWVDIDEEPEVAKLYGVTQAPAFGIAEGTSINLFSGEALNAEQIIQWVKTVMKSPKFSNQQCDYSQEETVTQSLGVNHPMTEEEERRMMLYILNRNIRFFKGSEEIRPQYKNRYETSHTLNTSFILDFYYSTIKDDKQ